jgi:hypothetical protein
VNNQPNDRKQQRRAKSDSSRMPEGSLFFEKVVPALLIVMAVIMVLLIGVAVAVLFGLVS